jgi:N-acyl-D-aspartate/D-glutamate deacylase
VYDLLFRGCRLIDGSGNPAVRSDVAVGGGRIAAVGRALGPARETIDAAGRVLAPGFIDSHSHNDLILERDPRLIGAVEQGITTLIGGNCGESAAPLSPARLRDTLRVCGAEHCADPAARYDFGAWRRGLPPLGANAAFLIGHGNLRVAAMALRTALRRTGSWRRWSGCCAPAWRAAPSASPSASSTRRGSSRRPPS